MTPFATIRNWIRASLSTQILLIIIPATFILVGLGAWLVHASVMNRLSEITEKGLVEASDTFEDVLQHALMINDTDMLQQLVFDMGVQRHANSVRLINRSGVVLASSIPDEIGIRPNRSETDCQLCHISSTSQLGIKGSQTFADSSQKIMLVANRIENRISCQGCHGAELRTLGLILVTFPNEQYEDWHTLFDTGLFFGALLIGSLISGVVYFSLSTRIVQPLRYLAHQWDPKPYQEGGDEIKEISRQIQQMGEALVDKENELSEEHRQIDTILSLQYNTNNPPSMEKFLNEALEIVQEVTGFASTIIRLYDPHTQSFRTVAQTEMSPSMLKELENIPTDCGFYAETAQTRWPVSTAVKCTDLHMISDTAIQEGYQILVCIPLSAHDNLMGIILLATKNEYICDEKKLRWLAVIGKRIGLPIHQIQLSERLRDMAVLEERSRIAQEIHDGLAQLIGSLRLWSEEALISLKDNDLSYVEKALQRIESVASDAYASLREEMLGLRDTIFPSKDLALLITEYLSRFQRQWGIRTRFRMENANSELLAWPISPATEIQLLRIIQEGLSNVRRHANASNITVALMSDDRRLVVQIQDDGEGFDCENIPDDRLGLRIMHERAASVGGTIAISSQAGQGTILEISFPLRGLPKSTDR